MASEISTDVCIVGGGPSGLMLALALARLGRSVVVLEKSKNFERSFRGESILPDSVWLLHRMGLLEPLRQKRVLEGRELEILDDGNKVLHVDFREFGRPQPYPMEIPQHMLLTVLAEAAQRYPQFALLQEHRFIDLIREDGRIVGVRSESPEGDVNVKAALVIGADGRYSKVRDLAEISYQKKPLERDVIWFRLPYPAEWKAQVYRIRLKGDHHAVFLPTHPDMVRAGFNIPKGDFKELRKEGIEALYKRMDELAPELGSSVREHIKAWSDTQLLDIFTTVVPRWSVPGLVLIGDAAHTLSPILGHGVNHALMDAIALAPMIRDALGQPNINAALDDAAVRFQQLREGRVRQARNLQLKQEKIFTLSSPTGTFLRRSIYRVINRFPAIKQRVLGNAYYTIQQSRDRDSIAAELCDKPLTD